jgi:hypothetical protein
MRGPARPRPPGPAHETLLLGRRAGPAGLDSTGRAESGDRKCGHAVRAHFFQATSTAQARPAQPATTVTTSE